MGHGHLIEEKPFKSLFQKLGWAFLLWRLNSIGSTDEDQITIYPKVGAMRRLGM